MTEKKKHCAKTMEKNYKMGNICKKQEVEGIFETIMTEIPLN